MGGAAMSFYDEPRDGPIEIAKGMALALLVYAVLYLILVAA